MTHLNNTHLITVHSPRLISGGQGARRTTYFSLWQAIEDEDLGHEGAAASAVLSSIGEERGHLRQTLNDYPGYPAGSEDGLRQLEERLARLTELSDSLGDDTPVLVNPFNDSEITHVGYSYEMLHALCEERLDDPNFSVTATDSRFAVEVAEALEALPAGSGRRLMYYGVHLDDLAGGHRAVTGYAPAPGTSGVRYEDQQPVVFISDAEGGVEHLDEHAYIYTPSEGGQLVEAAHLQRAEPERIAATAGKAALAAEHAAAAHSHAALRLPAAGQSTTSAELH